MPTIVTLVPPAGSPVAGVTEVIVGIPVWLRRGCDTDDGQATPRVPRHSASASAPFTKRREPTTNVSSHRLVTELLPLAFRPAVSHLPHYRLERTAFANRPTPSAD